MAEAGVVWVESEHGPRGFHEACATWLGLDSRCEGREAHHTEVCRGCGGFLLGPAPEHHGTKPAGFDAHDLLH